VAQARLGLIVNPIAGMGGRVGLKGTDGPATPDRARELGALPLAPGKAESLLRLLGERLGPDGFDLLAAPGEMGEDEARSAGIGARVVGPDQSRRGDSGGGRPPATTAEDTRTAAVELRDAGVDLLVFVGGDGTARDTCSAVGGSVPVVGVPAGVKMHSAVFATSVRAGAEVVASYLANPDPATCVDREVMDIDEEAARRGVVSASAFGALCVPPAGRLLQGLKAASAAGESVAMELLGAALERRVPAGDLVILGPGTTTRSIARRWDVPATLLGIDVLELGPGGCARLVVADAAERELLEVAAAQPTTIVVSPTGGQGFVLGRGNQPLSPALIRQVGLDRLVIVATPGKLASLGGRSLLLDTGDADLDRALSGYTRVVTGPGTESVCRLEPG